MRPQSHEEHIRHTFDSFCKKILKYKARDYYRKMKRRGEHEVSFSELSEDNVTGKLTDERFIKLSRDYEHEQDNLTAEAEAMRRDVKEQEQKKTNVKSFIATTKKYTDLQALDAAVLREFIDRIDISAMDRKSKERKIHIVYNFIGAFDFEAAIKQNNTNQEQRKTA